MESKQTDNNTEDKSMAQNGFSTLTEQISGNLRERAHSTFLYSDRLPGRIDVLRSDFPPLSELEYVLTGETQMGTVLTEVQPEKYSQTSLPQPKISSCAVKGRAKESHHAFRDAECDEKTGSI